MFSTQKQSENQMYVMTLTLNDHSAIWTPWKEFIPWLTLHLHVMGLFSLSFNPPNLMKELYNTEKSSLVENMLFGMRRLCVHWKTLIETFRVCPRDRDYFIHNQLHFKVNSLNWNNNPDVNTDKKVSQFDSFDESCFCPQK